MPSLILIKSPGGLPSGKAYPITGDGLVIGRDEACSVAIPNNAVSRKHAQLMVADGQVVLEDLASRNKTYLNNQELAPSVPHPLKHDDRVKICDYLFLFHDDKAARRPAPAAPAAAPDEDDDPDGTAVQVQHTVARGSAAKLLEVQPAERLRALLAISRDLSRTLQLDPLLPQIADTLFGVFKQADRCFIVMLDEAGRMVPKAVKSRRPKADDERFSKTMVRKCLDSGEAYVTEDASNDSQLGAAQSIAAIQIRSAMCVPLLSADGKPLGAIQLDTHDFTKKFKADDLSLLSIVANLAAVAVEKAQLVGVMMTQQKQQQEIELARKVQLGFLPQSCPEIDGYEFFAFYSAAQTVGGDYYDFIHLPGGRVAAVLGDVAGKGVPASLLMAKLSAEARFCFLTQPDPGKAISLLNEQLIRGGIGDRFVTFAALILDPAAHTLTMVNAGHINPQRYRIAAGEMGEAMTDAESGVPLGLMSGFEYEARTVPLVEGEALLLFTDGVTDAMSPGGEMFGFEGILRAVADDAVLSEVSPRAVGERLVKGVRGHAAGRAQNDDIAVVVLGRVEPAGPKTGSNLAAPRMFEAGGGMIKADGSGLIRLDPDAPRIAPPQS